jgi:hypothetical protein
MRQSGSNANKMRLGRGQLPTSTTYLNHYNGKIQKGGFGPVYAGSRFTARNQRGGGIGTFLTSIIRGISGIVDKTPAWVKKGANILAANAIKTYADYKGDLAAGADKSLAKKRALKAFAGDVMEHGAKQVKSGAGASGARPKVVAGEPPKKRKKCCKLKEITGSGTIKAKKKTNKRKQGRPKSIKGRSKFDLLSL